MKYIQDRWMEYLDSSDSGKRNRCCGYIHWSGYNPDSRSELEELRTMIQMAELQIENLQLKRVAQYQLGKHFYYASRNYNQALSYLRMATEQEHTGAMVLLGKIQITEGSHQDVMDGIDLLLKVKSQDNTECKELLAEIRHNRKQFAEIASRYQSIADQLKHNSMQQSEAVRFRKMWHNQLEAERYLKKKIKEQRRDSRSAKTKQRDDRSSR